MQKTDYPFLQKELRKTDLFSEITKIRNVVAFYITFNDYHSYLRRSPNQSKA